MSRKVVTPVRIVIRYKFTEKASPFVTEKNYIIFKMVSFLEIIIVMKIKVCKVGFGIIETICGFVCLKPIANYVQNDVIFGSVLNNNMTIVAFLSKIRPSEPAFNLCQGLFCSKNGLVLKSPNY